MTTNAIRVHKSAEGKLRQDIDIGRHRITADISEVLGGDAAGPDPHELLDAALGACTALTVTMVARRKQIPLTDLKVEITHTEADGLYRMSRKLEFSGALSDEQKAYLLGIANKCPVHRTLSGRFEIETVTTG